MNIDECYRQEGSLEKKGREKTPVFADRAAREHYEKPGMIPGLIAIPGGFAEQAETLLASFSNFVPIWLVAHLANVQGSPLTEGEVERFLILDGGLERCSLSGAIFQPVKILDVQRTLKNLCGRRLCDMSEDELHFTGCFIPFGSMGGNLELKSLAGAIWLPNNAGIISLSNRSPLALAMHHNARPDKEVVWFERNKERQLQLKRNRKTYSSWVLSSAPFRPGTTRRVGEGIVNPPKHRREVHKWRIAGPAVKVLEEWKPRRS